MTGLDGKAEGHSAVESRGMRACGLGDSNLELEDTAWAKPNCSLAAKLLIIRNLDADLFGLRPDALLFAHLWPLAFAGGSVRRVWVVRRDHSLAVVVGIFFVPAGYQPLGVAGQRVVGAINRKPVPQLCWKTSPDRPAPVIRTEQRISFV